MSDQPEEHKDGRFKETVSSEWEKIRADPNLYKDYMDRKRRYRQRVKNGEVVPRKRGTMFATAVRTPTRTSIISEVINNLYKVEWTPVEMPTVFKMLKELHGLEFKK